MFWHDKDLHAVDAVAEFRDRDASSGVNIEDAHQEIVEIEGDGKVAEKEVRVE